MFNILSEHISNKKMNMLKNDYDVFLHDYHKVERKDRKLGHITHISKNRDELIQNMDAILDIL